MCHKQTLIHQPTTTTTTKTTTTTTTSTTDLEDGRYDWSDVRQKVIGKHNRQVDEHHNVAVTDMWTHVCTTGSLHDVWH